MLNDPSEKYDAFHKPQLENPKWPKKSLSKPPRWLSTDLRDGNQALAEPMDGAAKWMYFQYLVSLGYKEIEVSYPSASETEYDFTRRLITTPGAVPDDVTIQVMAPCREDLIETTIKAAHGAKKVIIHIHVSTSSCFRNVVFNMTKQDMKNLAVRCTKLIRQLTKDSSDARVRQTQWTLEFTPENFQDTSVEYAVAICEAVKSAWEPSVDNQIIFNLPSTVEVAMPNVFADQIEYFCNNITEREKVCVSLHNHNDRGCAVATSEMGQLAGADRVEGCLFGNGERTGNVDLVTLAMNLYTQGINPGIDFSDLPKVVEMSERFTKIPVHYRAPYAGKYTFCTFTGTHQDAINKGYKRRRSLEEETGEPPKWDMPYLPMDPHDLGREHEAVIRINSQSGKGGVAWCIKDSFGINLPRELEIAFSKIVKKNANESQQEVTKDMIDDIFRSRYMLPEASEDLGILGCELEKCAGGNKVKLSAGVAIHNKRFDVTGSGTDVMSAIMDAVKQLGLDLEIIEHNEQVIDRNETGAHGHAYASFVKTKQDDKTMCWGVAIHENPTWAAIEAVLSAGKDMDPGKASKKVRQTKAQNGFQPGRIAVKA